MRKKRDETTGEKLSDRLEEKARQRAEDAIAEDKAIDAMIKRSIETQGP